MRHQPKSARFALSPQDSDREIGVQRQKTFSYRGRGNQTVIDSKKQWTHAHIDPNAKMSRYASSKTAAAQTKRNKSAHHKKLKAGKKHIRRETRIKMMMQSMANKANEEDDVPLSEKNKQENESKSEKKEEKSDENNDNINSNNSNSNVLKTSSPKNRTMSPRSAAYAAATGAPPRSPKIGAGFAKYGKFSRARDRKTSAVEEF